MYLRLLILGCVLYSGQLLAKIDLVTLPTRDTVEVTIYNQADLTLVREQRLLTLKKGINNLEFGWANTLIDPTSVELRAPHHQEHVSLLEISYPPNVTGSAIWRIESKVDGVIPVEISFFTSGVAWEAFYMATLSADEQQMQLQNYVRVTNRSGENYENASTRVVVGRIALLDSIAHLARRTPPYGMPANQKHEMYDMEEMSMEADVAMPAMASVMRRAKSSFASKPKQIQKTAVSEYFLYSIEGTEDLPDQWAKRLLSFDIKNIPVRTLYRYDTQRHGAQLQRLLYFKNDTTHQLGHTPLPDGKVMVYRAMNEKNDLSYINQAHTKYIPIEQEAEIDLGSATQVKLKRHLMKYETDNYVFHPKGQIRSFDQIETWELKLENYRDISVEVEVVRHVKTNKWIQKTLTSQPSARYEKVDHDTFSYHFTLAPHSKKTLRYQLRLLGDTPAKEL